MRDIIFRAKRTDNGEWVEGSLLTETHDIAGNIEKRCKISDITYGQDDEGFATYMSGVEEYVHQNTVCEWTGLTDKNGKKIWENDVVKTHYANAKKADFIEQVVFRKGKFCAKGHTTGGCRTWTLLWDGTPHLKTDASVYMDELEVIGNVFDNPDLLER